MRNSACTILIKTDRKQYATGQDITGKVCVSITNVKGTDASNLCVQFRGKESTGAYEPINQESYHEKALIIDLDVPIATFPNGRLEVGQYEYPFKLTLPEHLPSSMRCREAGFCEIKYKMRAYLSKGKGGRRDKAKSSKCELEIFSCGFDSMAPMGDEEPAPTGDETSTLRTEDTIRMKKGGCIDSGSMTLESEVDKEIYNTGENCKVSFRCLNQSTGKVIKAKVFLRQTVRWYAQGHPGKKRKTLVKTSLLGSDIPELMALNNRSRPQKKGEQQQQNIDDLLNGQPKHSMTLDGVPFSAHQSYTGSLICVYHKVLIRLITGPFVTNPDVRTEVQILKVLPKDGVGQEDQQRPASKVNFGNQMALPLNWNPQKVDEYTLPIEEATISDMGRMEGSAFSAASESLPAGGQY